MTRKAIKKLAQASYQELDAKKVDTISSLLSKKDLKEYIRQLKLIEKSQEVIVALPSIKSYNKGDKFFEELFGKKRIVYQEDPSLILGAKVTDNDIVYDINLKSRLEEAANDIAQNFE